MLIELRPGTPAEAAEEVAALAGAHEDVTAWPVSLAGRVFVVVSGDESLARVPASPAVLARRPTPDGHWLVRRENGVAPREVTIGSPAGSGREIGGGAVGGARLWWAAGPCALESAEDAVETALAVKAQGAHALRAGLSKTRSSPYNFPGKGARGLEALAEVRRAAAIPVITEVCDPREVEAVAEVADCLQVDGRQLDNRPLLAELGAQPRPVLLMRGPRASLDDWLRAAEFVLARGNAAVVLCAGASGTPPQPGFSAIAALRARTDLPVVFDPSHSTGSASLVAPASLAAAAYGADGLLIESCVKPERMYRPGDAAHMFPPESLADLVSACERARDSARSLAVSR
ncbi:3-deoxy-7-phosphoheptulonate synthase [Streptosporangium sp. V21-05]|uniref:3-deoxy-7-phosphoheptulonate synthase n=1 Tax=Streptosporangium sp. V21-05 TaxID=3446115 RepID=UPI003F5328BE